MVELNGVSSTTNSANYQLIKTSFAINKYNYKYGKLIQSLMTWKIYSKDPNREHQLKGKYHFLFILFGSAALLKLNEQQFYLFGQIQSSQIGGQPNSNTYPYGECFLVPDGL